MSSQNPLVSINLLTYNGEKYIKPCLGSVFAQSYPNINVLIMDNASSDNTMDEIKNYLSKRVNTSKISVNQRNHQRVSASVSLQPRESEDMRQQVTFLTSEKNLGFAEGHNRLIKESGGELVLCLNQDVVLDKDFIKNAVEVFEKDDKIGAVQGKLLRLVEKEKSDTIDTTGLLMLKNRRIVNRGQSQKDAGQFNRQEEIFGTDGAVPIYRRKALEDIKLPTNIRANPCNLWRLQLALRGRSGPRTGAESSHPRLPRVVSRGLSASTEYFDEDFFCYKEDVDLAWRLRLYGWKAVYQPKAIAWHARGSGDSAAFNPLAIIKERKKLSKISKFYSFKNQRLMQIKNELPSLFIKHFPRIIAKELAAWAYVLVFENYTLRAMKSLIKEMPGAFRKRKIIMANKMATSKEMERWFI